MAFVMIVPCGERPKRGDLLQTNCGDRRERTWLILAVRRIHSTAEKPRFKVWRVRWWELEAEFRIKLFRSSERNGGQVLWLPEPKKMFENLRRKKTCSNESIR